MGELLNDYSRTFDAVTYPAQPFDWEYGSSYALIDISFGRFDSRSLRINNNGPYIGGYVTASPAGGSVFGWTCTPGNTYRLQGHRYLRSWAKDFTVLLDFYRTDFAEYASDFGTPGVDYYWDVSNSFADEWVSFDTGEFTAPVGYDYVTATVSVDDNTGSGGTFALVYLDDMSLLEGAPAGGTTSFIGIMKPN